MFRLKFPCIIYMFHLTILESYMELKEAKKATQTLAYRYWPPRCTQAMAPSSQAREGVKYKELLANDCGRSMDINLSFPI